MKPVKFPESNVVFAEEQPEYGDMPAFRSEEQGGHVISCWKLSFGERLRVLFTGKMWMSLMMFGQPLTPSIITTKKSDVLVKL